MNRRHFLTALLASAGPLQAAEGVGGRRLGLVLTSYRHRWQGTYSSFKVPPFKDALDVMDHIRGLGFGSLQVPVQDWTLDFAQQVRRTCESYGMDIEGSIQLPVTEGDVGRFEQELRTAARAGVKVLRSALGGRRYEVFTQRADFEAWKVRALRSMTLAEPVARKLKVKIGIENHKDWELHELVAALQSLSSAHLGACVDTGNSLALLEDPLAVVEALAPYAVTVHLKDIAVREYEDGFHMSEVPLGQGSLDLPRIIRTLRAAQPGLPMHLEMITRDPLAIPCLTEGYWATFPDKPGLDLAHTLTWVKARHAAALPKISHLSKLATLSLEEENLTRSLAHTLDL